MTHDPDPETPIRLQKFLCFVKISGRVALVFFWAAQEHSGIYVCVYISLYILIDC